VIQVASNVDESDCIVAKWEEKFEEIDFVLDKQLFLWYNVHLATLKCHWEEYFGRETVYKLQYR
jgi:hypothetical protein